MRDLIEERKKWLARRGILGPFSGWRDDGVARFTNIVLGQMIVEHSTDSQESGYAVAERLRAYTSHANEWGLRTGRFEENGECFPLLFHSSRDRAHCCAQKVADECRESHGDTHEIGVVRVRLVIEPAIPVLTAPYSHFYVPNTCVQELLGDDWLQVVRARRVWSLLEGSVEMELIGEDTGQTLVELRKIK